MGTPFTQMCLGINPARCDAPASPTPFTTHVTSVEHVEDMICLRRSKDVCPQYHADSMHGLFSPYVHVCASFKARVVDPFAVRCGSH